MAALANPQASRPRLVFVLDPPKILEGSGCSDRLSARAVNALEKAFRAHPGVLTALPPGAPTEPRALAEHLRKHKLTAFRMTAELTACSLDSEVDNDGRQQVVSHLAMHLFAESLPVRKMAFHGSGEATVKLGIMTKAVRPSDLTEAEDAALREASQQAAVSIIQKVNAGPTQPTKQ